MFFLNLGWVHQGYKQIPDCMSVISYTIYIKSHNMFHCTLWNCSSLFSATGQNERYSLLYFYFFLIYLPSNRKIFSTLFIVFKSFVLRILLLRIYWKYFCCFLYSTIYYAFILMYIIIIKFNFLFIRNLYRVMRCIRYKYHTWTSQVCNAVLEQ